ncbi:LysR family transcriptional regulator [Krasilnikoviella flava]|uniref:DNA-binding transcriptional regulator, LysR family n=1 Tax=Krasilnikoviella flava TaxID=526729 RepID=A0A1T5IRZ7_9MICO|nr:LysR family transcriptional regulator [Krasilnikoviella flava]SKC41920.1 DNA-binding transcriptional regulator, LysR family [Krasilnikoviella flava]
MASRLTVDDLQLAEAVARHGSVGAAARELLVAQPSASRRLATLERRLGTPLFDRDTTGARPTPAGRELARLAARLLGDLDALPDQVLAAVDAPSLSVGTIQALSPMVLTAVELELDGVTILPEVDHGPVLVRQVHDGTLDAAIVTVAEQMAIPRGLQRTPLGESPRVVVLPDGAPPLAGGSRPFAGRTVVYSLIDLAGEATHRRLSALGAVPRRGPTTEATLRIARELGCPALMPELTARWYAAPGDRIVPSPVPGAVRITLVTRTPQPAALTEALPRITARVLGEGRSSDRAATL